MIYKICKKCGGEKIINKFYFRKDRNKFRNECKDCTNERSKKYRHNNVEKLKKYYQKNIEKRKKNYREWRKNNLAKRKEYEKKYNIENKEKRKKWRENNLKRIKEKSKKYYQNNREKINQNKKYYNRLRRKIDIHFKLKDNISRAINQKLTRRLNGKNGKSTFSFIPYTVDELKQHLERQFEPWMNWNNWSNKPGCWSIDHIRPDSSFNYKSVEDKEFQECWALKNLRPLDHIENVRKNKLYGNQQ